MSRFLSLCVFFFTDTATSEIYTLSLHDALPISAATEQKHERHWQLGQIVDAIAGAGLGVTRLVEFQTLYRSEEHTSELQSRLHLVCRLLLEKKKKNQTSTID